MKGSELIAALKEKFDVNNNANLAKYLDVSVAHPGNLEKRQEDLKPYQVSDIVDKAMKAKVKEISKTFINPIAEYCPIPTEKGNSKRNMLPSLKKGEGLRKQLENANLGIYVFYNSSGRAIYVGKTADNKNTLWMEMYSAFNNRKMKIYHTENGATSKTKGRLPKPEVKLREMARYFSAYEIINSQMCHNIEVFLLRAFANDLPVNINTGIFHLDK